MGIEPLGSLQAVVFAAMFSGVVSMPEEIIARNFGASKKALMENFQRGTETALARANFLRTTKIETLQALVMYMVREDLYASRWFTLNLSINYSFPHQYLLGQVTSIVLNMPLHIIHSYFSAVSLAVSTKSNT